MGGQRSSWAKRLQPLAAGVWSVSALACAPNPGVLLDPNGALETSESGGSVQVRVTLAARPLGSVRVRAISEDDSEGRVSAALEFTPSTWREAQTITITGIDDADHDGDVEFRVRFEESNSVRPHDAPIVFDELTFLNRDDDEAHVEPVAKPDSPKPEDVVHDDPPNHEGTRTPVETSESEQPAPLPCDASGFVGLGAGTRVAGATPDGSVIVGGTRDRAFRWTGSLGLQLLTGSGFANGVSPNGKLITGSASGAAVVWNDSASEPQALPAPSPSEIVRMASGRVILDDGRLFGTCVTLHSPIEQLACAWDGHALGPIGATTVNAADATGVYAGTARPDPRDSDHTSRAVLTSERFTPPGCAPYLGCVAEFQAFTPDHAVVVGTASLPLPSSGPPPSDAPLFETAIFYTPTTLIQRLDDLPGGEVGAGAYAVSADGRVIAGFASDAVGRRAALWIDKEPRALADVLSKLGVEVPAGWVLSSLRAISSDGRVLIGNGIDPNGEPEGFRVVLPSAL